MTTSEKKESFRKYLETAGVIDALTKGLVSLYEAGSDRPPKAVDFLKNQMGGPTSDEFEAMVSEKESLAKELDHTKRTVEQLQAKIQELEAALAQPK